MIIVAQIMIGLIATVAFQPHAFGDSLDCTFGHSELWGSAWCDFAQPTTIPSGVCLRLGVAGTTNKVVVVRILGGCPRINLQRLCGSRVTVRFVVKSDVAGTGQ